MSKDIELKDNSQPASDLIGAGRVVCGVQYDGSHFHGWQIQNSGVPSVQQSVERAISTVANESISVVCAGRTDAKVHATGQIIHFDTQVTRTRNSWIKGVNAHLPPAICLDWVSQADSAFHARFSAESRRYRYLIYNDAVKPALLNKQLTWSHWPLDAQVMNDSAQVLVGEHDFSSFRASECQSNTPFRNVHFVKVIRRGKIIEVDIQANAFLHHMVRNIVGVLMYVGAGRASPSWVEEVLNARDRSKGGVTAPPYGLYLVDVVYPERYNVPSLEVGPFFLSF